MVGKKFGRLTVLDRAGSQDRKIIWRCLCECGAEAKVRGTHLRMGEVRSCGCLRSELSRDRQHKKLTDLSGLKFGRYTVLRYHESQAGAGQSGSTMLWWCRCDCGREKPVRTNLLKYSAEPKCQDCQNQSMFDHGWPVKALFKRYRDNAATRGLEFRLTIEEVADLTSKPCHYCGDKDVGSITHPHRPEVSFRHNGIDRLDGGDYETGNAVPCCWPCNRMKGALTYDQFMRRCRAITDRTA